MNCYIFDVHINCCFIADTLLEDGIYIYTHDLVEEGPLNMISSDILSRVQRAIRRISSDTVPVNWWTEFSSWEDFRGLLRTGTKLSIHTVVENLTSNMETLESFDTYVETVDENGNIEIEISENNEHVLQSFTVRARRKRLRTLKEIAAYNVAQHLSSDSDVGYLNVPQTLHILVKKFINTYSGDYIIDMNSN